MTELIAHRKNTIEELKTTPTKYGIEVDIRSFGNKLVIHHDPFTEGESFENWLTEYRHGTLALNVKEEGLEARLIDLMKSHKIEDYFFLDQSFSFLVKWAFKGEHRCAVRVSEFESMETALSLTGRIDWAWVDYFTYFPLTEEDAWHLQNAGFKLCLVSPELQGLDAAIEIPKLKRLLLDRNIHPTAICTKFPELWNEITPS